MTQMPASSSAPESPPKPMPHEGSVTSDEVAPFLLVPDPPHVHSWRAWVPHWFLARHVFRLAMPVVFGMLTQTAINVLDTVMVGRLPKEIANPGQAAIGPSLPLMWLVGGCLSAVWVGTLAITSRRAGEGRQLLAGRALTNSLLISLTAGVTASIAAILVAPTLVAGLFSDALMVDMATDYLQVRLVGVLSMALTFSYKSFFDGIGRTKLFMIAAIVMNTLNVVLNYFLIFGFEPLGIPRLEVVGAAWASVISAYTGLGIMVFFSFSPRMIRRYHYYRVTNLNRHVIREILRLSVPNAAATMVVMVGFVAFYWVVDQVNVMAQTAAGNPLVATANQDLVTIVLVGFMSSLAFGQATATLVSQSLGAKRPWLAEKYGWEAVKVWSYVMVAYGVLMVVFPEAILHLVTLDPEVVRLAAPALQMMGLMQGIAAVGTILAQTLYGVGSATYVMYVELFLHVVVMSPTAYLCGVVLGWGLPGVYVGPCVYVLLLAVAMLWKYNHADWKENVV